MTDELAGELAGAQRGEPTGALTGALTGAIGGRHTDVVLLRCTLPSGVADLAALARAWCNASALGLLVQRAAVSADAQLYLYAALHSPRAITSTDLALCHADWQARCPGATGLDVARLALAFDTPGASHDTTQPVLSCAHYVVEMDPEPGWAEQLFAWYDEEHMPGLASVPGTVRASRYINHDAAQPTATPDATPVATLPMTASESTAAQYTASKTPLSAYPYSIACYDLLEPNVLGSPPWLAVRGTAWSDTVRPHFMNTRRTMMGIVA